MKLLYAINLETKIFFLSIKILSALIYMLVILIRTAFIKLYMVFILQAVYKKKCLRRGADDFGTICYTEIRRGPRRSVPRA